MAFMSDEDRVKKQALGMLPKHRGRLLHSHIFPGRLVPATCRYYDIEFHNGDCGAMVSEVDVRRPEAAVKGSVRLATPDMPSRAIGETAAPAMGGAHVGHFHEGDVVEAKYDSCGIGRVARRFYPGVVRKCHAAPAESGEMVVRCVTQPVPQHLMSGVEALRMEVELRRQRPEASQHDRHVPLEGGNPSRLADSCGGEPPVPDVTRERSCTTPAPNQVLNRVLNASPNCAKNQGRSNLKI